MKCLGASTDVGLSPSMMGHPGNVRSLWHVCIVRMRPVWRFVQRTAFIRTRRALFCTPKICVLAAGIVFMPVRLARHSSHKLATSVAAARWTNARSVQGVLKKHTPLRSLQNMDATGLQRENFQSVRKCARRKLFLRVTVMSFPQYIANA